MRWYYYAHEGKMHTGELYLPNDDSIMTEQTARLEHLYDFNRTRPSEGEKLHKRK